MNLYISLNDKYKDTFLATGSVLLNDKNIDVSPLISVYNNAPSLLNELSKIRNSPDEKDIILAYFPQSNAGVADDIDDLIGGDFLDDIEAYMSDTPLDLTRVSHGEDVYASHEANGVSFYGFDSDEEKLPAIEPVLEPELSVIESPKTSHLPRSELDKFKDTILVGPAPPSIYNRVKPAWFERYVQLSNSNERYVITKKGTLIFGTDLDGRLRALQRANKNNKKYQTSKTRDLKIKRKKEFVPRTFSEYGEGQLTGAINTYKKNKSGNKTRGGIRDLKQEKRDKFRKARKEAAIEQAKLAKMNARQRRRYKRAKQGKNNLITESYDFNFDITNQDKFDVFRSYIEDIIGCEQEDLMCGNLNVGKFSVCTMSWLYLLYTTDSYGQWAAATTNYILAVFPGSYDLAKNSVSSIIKQIWELMVKSASKLRTESIDVQSFLRVMNSTIVSPIIDLIKKLFIILVGTFAGKNTCSKVFKWTGLSTRFTLWDLISVMLESIYSLWDLTSRLMNGDSVSDLFTKGDSVNVLITELTELNALSERTFHGVALTGFISERVWLLRAREALNSYQTIFDDLIALDPRKHTLASLYNKFIVIYNEKESGYFGRDRVAPMAILIHGFPGIGKSNIINMVFNKWAHVRGEEFHNSMIFQQNKDSEYSDGYHPISTPYMYMSELGAQTYDSAKTQGDPRIQTLLSLVSSETMACNMSKAEDKGLYFFRPSILVCDTNNIGLNLDAVLSAPAAARRRFLYIDVKLKQEYRRKGTQQVDSEKARLAPHEGLDIYEFTLFRQEALGNMKSKTLYLCESVGLYDMLDVLQQEMENHNANQAEFSGQVMLGKVSSVIDAHSRKNLDGFVDSNNTCDDDNESNFGEVKYDVDGNVIEPIEEKFDFFSDDESFETRAERISDSSDTINFIEDSDGEARYWMLAEARYNSDDWNSDLKSDDEDVMSAEDVTEAKEFKSSIPMVIPVSRHSKKMSKALIKNMRVKWPLANIPKLRILERCSECTRLGLMQCFHEDFLGWDFDAKVNDYNRENAVQLTHTEFYQILSMNAQVMNVVGPKISLDFVIRWLAYITTFVVFVQSVLTIHFKATFWRTYKRGYTEINPTLIFYCIAALYMYVPLGILVIALSLLWVCFGYGLSRVMVYRDAKNKLTNVKLEISKATYTTAYYGKALWARLTGVFDCAYDPVLLPKKISTVAVVGGVGIAIIAIHKAFKMFRAVSDITEDKTVFVDKSSSDEDINKIEELTGVERSCTRVKGRRENIWTDIRMSPNQPLNHGNADEFVAGVYKKYVRYVQISYNIGGELRTTRTHIMGVSGNFLIINSHAIQKSDGNIQLEFFNDSECVKRVATYTLQPEEICHVGGDVSVIQCIRITFSNLLKHIVEAPITFPTAVRFEDEQGFCHPKTVELVNDFGNVKLEPAIVYRNSRHKVGLCGLPLFGYTSDTGLQIIGIHAGGNTNGPDAYAAHLYRERIELGIKTIKNRLMMHSASPVSESFDHPAITMPLGHDPVPKSVFNYEHTQFLEYYGYDKQPILLQSKSKLVHSIIAKSLPFFFEKHFDFVPSEFYGPPMMKSKMVKGVYVSPYNMNINKMDKCAPQLNILIIQRVIKEYTEFIISNIPANTRLKPVSLSEAINGAPKDDYLRALNVKASAGYGLKGKKKEYFVTHDLNEIAWDDIANYPEMAQLRELTSDERRLYAQFLGVCLENEYCPSVFKGQLKDEPRPEDRCLTGNTRLFYMTPLILLVTSRSYLSPFYTLMVQFPEAFCSAVGINMHTGAHDLYKRLTEFSELIMEGDYSGYDMNNCPWIAKAANTVIINILTHFGYNESAINIVNSLLTAHMYPIINMLGDMFSKPGLQPSGRYGTAEDNSLRNTIMQMYNYYTIEELWETSFFDNVLPVNYGDDLLTSIKPDVSEFFNGVVYRDLCLKNYGMKFTPAVKGNEMTPFMPLGEMGFLKRNFAELYGRIVAPLEMCSIYKSLNWSLPSAHITRVEQLISNIQSMLWELFFHCDSEDKYTVVRSDLLDMLYKDHLNLPVDNQKFPTFSDIYSSVYNDVRTESNDDSRSQTDVANKGQHFCNNPLNSFRYEVNIPKLHVKINRNAEEKINFPKQEFHSMKDELAYLKSFPYASEDELYYYTHRPSSELKQTSLDFQDYCRRGMRVYELESTIKTVARIKRKRQNRTESAEMTQGIATDHDQMENLGEGAGNPTDKEMWNASDALDVGQSEYLDLDDFFMRPIEIADFSIPTGLSISNVYSVWNLYTINQSVRAKLKNYAYLRGGLTLRIVITGSPFHAGRILVSYQPFANRNLTLTSYNSLGGVARRGLLSYLSQSNLCTIIDVKNNTPIELEIPYLSHKPAMRLWNTSNAVITDLTPFEDAIDLGDLYVYTLNDVSGPVGAADIRVQIYARMTNVSLGVPTSTVMSLIAESDERKTGPIEKVASSTVEWMSALERVPAIAPLATPSKMIASGIGSIASLYGWSYPYTVNNVGRVKNEPYQNGSNTIGMSSSRKISLDPLQELTIDPRLGGQDVDEMSIPFLCGKKTLVYTFDWNVGDATGVPIFSALAHPGISSVFSSGSIYVQPTPMAMVSNLFKYWRGDIVYTFEFVTSNFDRGKVGVHYEPNISQFGLFSSGFDLNKNFIDVIDLQETQSVSYCLDWAKDRAWARCYSAGTGNAIGTSVGVSNDMINYSNGIISLFPFTGLTNNDMNPVRVNVYIHGENMHFNQLSDDGFPSNRLITESDDLSTVPVECRVLNPTSATDAHISLQHFGEEMHSLRSLIKRFVTSYQTQTPVLVGFPNLKISIPLYPLPEPTYGVGSVVFPSVLKLLPLAYMAMRGSLRFRVNVTSGTSEITRGERVSVSLAPITSSSPGFSVTRTTEKPAMKTEGSLLFIPATNAGVEFETPCYTNNLFMFSFTDNYVGPNPNDGVYNSAFSKHVEVVWPGNETVPADISVETAAGEDFSFYCFTGVPFYRI